VGTKRAAPSGPRGGGEPGAAKQASPDSGLPDTTTASYGDWVLRCSLQSGEKLCEVAQTLRLQGRQDPFAVIAVGREQKHAPLRFVVQVPINVSIADGAQLRVGEDSETLDFPFVRCVPQGCFAETELSDVWLQKLRAQSEGALITFRDGTRQEVRLSLSLRGFPDAMDGLSAE
jgi:invasion protein IalB